MYIFKNMYTIDNTILKINIPIKKFISLKKNLIMYNCTYFFLNKQGNKDDKLIMGRWGYTLKSETEKKIRTSGFLFQKSLYPPLSRVVQKHKVFCQNVSDLQISNSFEKLRSCYIELI